MFNDELYQQYRRQIIWLRKNETTGNPAVFFLRMLMEGRDTDPHMPKTVHKRISLAKQLADVLKNGLRINNTEKRISLHIPEDIVIAIYSMFQQDISTHASTETKLSFQSGLLDYLRSM